MKLDIKKIRQDFPQLQRKIRGKDLIYFDNGATTLKPLSVIESLDHYYRLGTANVHRGVHFLSEEASSLFEETRLKLQKFINAKSEREIIFTKGTTESFNLLVNCLGRSLLKRGDEVIITAMEHHANIVPWQILRDEFGIVLTVAPIDHNGEVQLEELKKLLSGKTKVVSFVHTSNSLGTVNPVAEILRLVKNYNSEIITVVDLAQAVAHQKIDVQTLDMDFACFSGHKMLGPTGVGVLYGKETLLEKLPPYQGGGDMILSVTFEKTLFNQLPYKFEAGTPAIAEVIALKQAVEYLEHLGLDKIHARENELSHYLQQELKNVEDLKIIGTAKSKAPLASFTLGSVHPHDVGTYADEEGIALRTGHHCTQPVMKFFNVPATTRASLSFYNTQEEIDHLVIVLKKIREFFL